MFPRKFITYILAGSFMFTACKKNDSGNADNSSDNEDDCFQNASIRGNGAEISGAYIVAYKPSAVSGRGISAERIKALSTDVLQKHNISNQALRASFAGEPGGFIATLSAEEASRLKTDENIAAIEPDKIISLGSCFTVVAPRLVTWNIERVGYGNGTGKRAWIIDCFVVSTGEARV